MTSIPNRKLVNAGLLLGACVLAFAYLSTGRGTVDANERIKNIVEATTAARTAKPIELSRAEITSVSPGPIAERLRISGDLQPARSVVLRSKIAGRITDVPVREGQVVKAGDVILRFESNDLRSTLFQRQSDRSVAEAELSLAVQALARSTQLAKNNAIPVEKLEKAHSDVAIASSRLDSLSAQVDMARLALRDAEVLAPFDGLVSGKAPDEGTRVGSDAELLTVVDMSAMDVKVLVSTRDIARVTTGQTAELQFDGMESQTFRATVNRINPVADSGTRFVTVYLRLPPSRTTLWGGMFASGSILVREKAGAVLVPATSLRKDGGGHYVLKLENGYLRRQTVTVGASWNGGSSVDIATGLRNGDTIVTAPLPELQPDIAIALDKVG